MSKKRKNSKKTTNHTVSILIILGMFIFVPMFIYFSENRNQAVQEVWKHIQALSYIVVGYLYGNHKDTNS